MPRHLHGDRGPLAQHTSPRELLEDRAGRRGPRACRPPRDKPSNDLDTSHHPRGVTATPGGSYAISSTAWSLDGGAARDGLTRARAMRAREGEAVVSETSAASRAPDRPLVKNMAWVPGGTFPDGIRGLYPEEPSLPVRRAAPPFCIVQDRDTPMAGTAYNRLIRAFCWRRPLPSWAGGRLGPRPVSRPGRGLYLRC